jgi:hypothetical protein
LENTPPLKKKKKLKGNIKRGKYERKVRKCKDKIKIASKRVNHLNSRKKSSKKELTTGVITAWLQKI